MKKRFHIFLLPLFLLGACSRTETSEQSGYLVLRLSGSGLKAGVELSDFTLHISNGDNTVLTQRVGDVAGPIALAAGTYTFEVYSDVFSEPKFETPVYRGTKEVNIIAGETAEAAIICSQDNAGIKIIWSPEFADLYQTWQAEVRHDQGYLVYSATETRTGYFLPGNVTLKMSADGNILNGGTFALAAKDMVTVTLRPKESPTGDVSVDISVDVSVNEREIEIIIDPDEENGEPAENSEINPYTVAEAIARQGESGVWVTGYIVGSKPSADWDFTNSSTWQSTNIILADDISETNSSKCIPVELGTGSFRTNLNLPAHPELLHREIVIKGALSTYFYNPGLRSISNYSLKQP